MTEFFKKLGQGLLYTLVLPVLIVVLAGYSVYGLIIFIIMLFKSIILFFRGKSINSDLPEDIEAKRRLKALTNPFDNPPPPPEPKEERDPVIIIERPKEDNIFDVPEERKSIENKEINPYLINRQMNENRFPEINDRSVDEEIFEEQNQEENIDEEDEYNEPATPSAFEGEEERELNIAESDDEILPPDDDDMFDDEDSEEDTAGVSISDWSDK